MKQIETDKSLLDNILGLSCVENYLLYICVTLGYDYRPLYAKSFTSVFDVAVAFCDEAVSYAYFDKIPRLQDAASEQGLISLSDVYDFQKGVYNYDYCCIRVTQNFVAQHYGREFWRNDHFILLCNKNKENWICLNDNPRDIIVIKDNDMSQIYAEQSVCFNILSNVNADIKNNLLIEFRKKITLPPKTYRFNISDLIVARDILGILRITRKRIYEYCSLYFETDFMKDYLSELDSLYVTLEYMRLRRNTDFPKINRTFEHIQIRDFEIIALLNKRLEMVK